MSQEAKIILAYLNQKSGRYFRMCDTNLKPIEQRMKDLHIKEWPTMKPEDWCKAIIDKKCFKWKTNPEMCVYLRPSTLFGKKNFENYLSEVLTDLQEEKK